MTPKSNIEMTVTEAVEFKRDIIRKVTVRLTYSAITIAVAMITTAFSFYYNTTYTLKSHDEKIEKLEKGCVNKEVYEQMNNKVEGMDKKLDYLIMHSRIK